MSSFTVPTVRAALVVRAAELLLAAGDTTTKVLYGPPGQKLPARFVSVSTTVDGVNREQRTLPLRTSGSRTESYGIRLVLWCQDGRHDDEAQQLVTEACWSTLSVLDQGLRAEPTLSSLVTSALITSADDDDFLLDRGRASQIVAVVTVNLNRA